MDGKYLKTHWRIEGAQSEASMAAKNKRCGDGLLRDRCILSTSVTLCIGMKGNTLHFRTLPIEEVEKADLACLSHISCHFLCVRWLLNNISERQIWIICSWFQSPFESAPGSDNQQYRNLSYDKRRAIWRWRTLSLPLKKLKISAGNADHKSRWIALKILLQNSANSWPQQLTLFQVHKNWSIRCILSWFFFW